MFYNNPLYKISEDKRYLESPDNSAKTDKELQKQEKKEKEKADLINRLNETIFIPKPLPPANDLSKPQSELKYPADFAEAKAISQYIADTPFCKSIVRSHLIYCAAIWVGFIAFLVLFFITKNTDHWVWATILLGIVVVLGLCYLIQSIVSAGSELRFVRLLREGKIASKYSFEQIIEFSVNVVDAHNEYEKKQAEKKKRREKKG